jgi:CO/xanthine dehydrogenase Mo-binding subunit
MIGAALTRLGAEPLLTGRGRFVADVRAEGMLEAVVLRSRHAHARIVRLDTRRARSLLGVRAILTADDVPANSIIPNRVPVPEESVAGKSRGAPGASAASTEATT